MTRSLRPAAPSSASGADREHPRLSQNVELCGRSHAPGFSQPQWLVREGDRFLQVSELLYRLAEHLDGHNATYEELADRLTAATAWEVTPDAARGLVDKLRPLGLLDEPQGPPLDVAPPSQSPPPSWQSPLLTRASLKVVGAQRLDRPSDVLKHMFRPEVLIAILPIAALAHVWMYAEQGIFDAVQQVLLAPASVLAVLAVVILGGLAHELGHAAALRFAGGRARSIGVGVFVIFPIFYTDVTDTYRFGRRDRLRVDLGGFYFHLLFTTLLIAAYLPTRAEFLLVVVGLINLDTLRQLIPFLRLDGYWALCDLVGVPDLHQQAAQYLRRRDGGSRAPSLRKWPARIALAYMAIAIPVLGGVLVLLALRFPMLAETTWTSLQLQADALSIAWSAGDLVAVASSAAQILMMLLPVIGFTTITYLVVRALAPSLLRRAAPPDDTPSARPAPAVESPSATGTERGFRTGAGRPGGLRQVQ
jgi:putative peptide zinc metalloprotease protein